MMKSINEGNLRGECTSITVLREISDIEYNIKDSGIKEDQDNSGKSLMNFR